jgi:hypothetical protein
MWWISASLCGVGLSPANAAAGSAGDNSTSTNTSNVTRTMVGTASRRRFPMNRITPAHHRLGPTVIR